MRSFASVALAVVAVAAVVGVADAGDGTHLYKWDDRAGTKARVQKMVDWAEGRKPVDASEQQSLLQQGSSVSSRTRAQALLGSWRTRHSKIADAEERRRKVQAEAQEQVARLQMELARKRSQSASLLEVEEEMQRAGGEQTFASTKRIAGVVYKLAHAARQAAKEASGEDGLSKSMTKFLEQGSFVEGQDESEVAGSGVPSQARFVEQDTSVAAVDDMVAQYDPTNAYTPTEPAVPHTDEQAERMEAEKREREMKANERRAARRNARESASGGGMRFRAQRSGAEAAAQVGEINTDGKDASCAMCIYYMEMLEREVGFPSRTYWSDSYPSYSGVQDYAGPGAYFKGVTGRTPPVDHMADPVPGPGFVYSFLQLASERLGHGSARGARTARRLLSRNPADPWVAGGDYAFIGTESQNLKQRLAAEVEAEPREEATYQREVHMQPKPLAELYAAAGQHGDSPPQAGAAVRGPDDPAMYRQIGRGAGQADEQAAALANFQAGNGVEQGRPIQEQDGLSGQRAAAEAWMKDHPLGGAQPQGQAQAQPQGVALLETQETAAQRGAAPAPVAPAADDYDPSHDPFFGMRETEEARAAPPTELLETRAEVAAEASAERMGGFGNALKQGVGLSVCREGVDHCRPMLKHEGRRALERRARIQSRDAEFARTRAMMDDALREICNDAPDRFQKSCMSMTNNLDQIVDSYLHDYDDSEICSDIGMCSPTDLGIASKPRILPPFP